MASADLFIRDLAETALTNPSVFDRILEDLALALDQRRPAPFAEAARRCATKLHEARCEYGRRVDDTGRWSWEASAMVADEAEPELPGVAAPWPRRRASMRLPSKARATAT